MVCVQSVRRVLIYVPCCHLCYHSFERRGQSEYLYFKLCYESGVSKSTAHVSSYPFVMIVENRCLQTDKPHGIFTNSLPRVQSNMHVRKKLCIVQRAQTS